MKEELPEIEVYRNRIRKLIQEYENIKYPLNICCIGHIMNFVENLEELLK